MIELLHCVGGDRRAAGRPRRAGRRTDGRRHAPAASGVGIIEAPRGTLIHHYEVGDDDLVTMCNLIVSTTHNNQAMNEAVRSVARDYLDGHELTEGLLNHIEVAIRAYDPCLSCATHALGQMPLEVTLRRRRRRDARPRAAVAAAAASRDRPWLKARPHDGAAAGLRLGQRQPRRRRAGAAVRASGCALRCAPSRRRRVPRRLPVAGRTRARPASAASACSSSTPAWTARAPFEAGAGAGRADGSISSHALSPQALLQVYRELHGAATPPPCTLLAIRGVRFELGEPLSAAALAHLDAALRWARGWLSMPQVLRRA